MGLLAYACSLYDIDTLDTRFTTPSAVPYQTVVDARADPDLKKDAPDKPRARGQPSKWKTPEFYFYLGFLGFMIPYMFWIAYEVSRRASSLSMTLRDTGS